MKFRFIGEEPSFFFGFHWAPGVVHDVSDPHAVRKLTNSVLFEAVGPKAAAPDGPDLSDDELVGPTPKRRGRPPKVRNEIEDDDE